MRQTQPPTRRRKRLKRLDEDKCSALLAAAVEEVAERGPEAFSLQRVAARAGITRGLVYYYWEDREELLLDVVGYLRRILSDAVAQWGDPSDRDSYWASVERVYGEAFRSLAAKPHHLELFRRLVEASQARQTPEPIAAIVIEAREAMAKQLEVGQTLGAVRSDLPLALLLDATFALTGAADAWAIREVADGAEPDTCIAATMTLLRGVVGPPA